MMENSYMRDVVTLMTLVYLIGKVATFSILAAAIKSPRAVRAVGTALRKNPYAPEVPCHRVVASDLSLGGFQGSKGDITLKRKIEMLVKEGVDIQYDTADKADLRKKVKIDEKFVERSIQMS
jgi:methylated-DNA-[protein]-cysteine S-methyltransferase